MKRHNLHHHFRQSRTPSSDMSYYPIYSLPEDTSHGWCRTNAAMDGSHSTMSRTTANFMNMTPIQAWNAFDATPLEEIGVDQLYGASAATQFPRAGDSQTSSPSVTGHNIPQCKVGRPRFNRTPILSTTPRQTTCLPHKQVERKYREGLNLSFERLRRAVPTLPRSVDSDVMGSAKPSKGMVLAAAIEYIKRIEMERDAALRSLQKGD